MTKPSTTNVDAATNNNNTDSTNGAMTPKKPRRSIKVEGNCLSNMLREGYAKVTDASRLGKRLSSEIWNSFGAIQVPDDFTNPSIETKTVADGPATVKICHYFVACGKCFSVFKYDGHAYGTTGLVKHLKNCQGTNNQRFASGNANNFTLSNSSSSNNNNNNTSTPSILDHQSNSDEQNNTSNMSADNNINDNNRMTSVVTNKPITKTNLKRKKDPPTILATNRGRQPSQPSIRQLVRVIEDLRNEQIELRQKIQEMLTMMGPGYTDQIQIINQGEQVEETFEKAE